MEFIKPLSKPTELLKLEAAYRRVLAQDPIRKWVEEEFAKMSAGFYGERQLVYHLSHIQGDEVYAFHDLRIPIREGEYFQIDFLVVTRSALIIYDSKNLTGELFLDRYQLTQTVENGKRVYPNPVTQVENQVFHLHNLILRYFNVKIPIIFFVVLSNTNATFRYDLQYEAVPHRVIRPAEIRQFSNAVFSKHQKEILTSKQLQQLNQLLLQLHTPKTMTIKSESVKKGIYCSKCTLFTVKRISGEWRCLKCMEERELAPVQALIDYSLLFKPWITTRECCDFLQIPSRFVIRHLFQYLNLQSEGSTYRKIYHLHQLLSQNQTFV